MKLKNRFLLQSAIILTLLFSSIPTLTVHAQTEDKIVTITDPLDPGKAALYSGTYVYQGTRASYNGSSGGIKTRAYYKCGDNYLYADYLNGRDDFPNGFQWVIRAGSIESRIQTYVYAGWENSEMNYPSSSGPAWNWWWGDSGGNDVTVVVTNAASGVSPSVTTFEASLVTNTSGTMGGNVTADGGATTDRGFVYSSTDSTPTIGEPGVTQITDGTGTGTYSEVISGLTAGLTYYYQAYAHNTYGTAYGSVKSFTTPTTSSPNKYVSNAGGANGIYVWIGLYYGKPAWKHETLNYWLYYSRYGLSAPGTYYWFIDDDLKDEHGAEDFNFDHVDAADCPSSGWRNPDNSAAAVTITDYPQVDFTNGAAFSPGNPTGGTNNNPVGRFFLDADTTGGSLTGVTINLAGTRSGVTNIRLWSSTDATFNSGSDTQLNSQSDGTTVTFTGFSSAISATGTYYYLTADLDTSATGTFTPTIGSKANLTISGGATSTVFSNAPLTSGALTIITVIESNVTGNSNSIADGDTTPSTTDYTDFGSADITSSSIEHTFTIQSLGAGTLNLTGSSPYVTITGATGDFSVSAIPSNSIAGGSSTTFNITFDPTTTGLRSATVSIANNDTDENPYDFSIQGTGTSTSEMNISGNSVSIVSGDVTPSAADDTDFGQLNVSASPVEHTFTITNTGSATLSLTGVSPYVTVTGSDFSVTQIPSSSIAAGGGTTTFRLSFDPSTTGTKSATVSIANNDADENPYTFAIQGVGISAPVLTTSTATSISGTGATLGGNVTADGGATVSGRGVVYSSINPTPIIGGANVTQDTNGTGTGVFSEAISGLSAATHYYYQAYAINSEGTTYGGVEEFTTLNAVTSISRAGSTPTNASSVSWTVEFGSSLTGLTSSNFSLAATGITGPAITGVTGSGTTWTVTAGTGTGSGTLGLNLTNDTGLSAALSNEPFTGEVYTIDRAAPTVTINQAAGQADPAGSSPVNFTVTFNEAVTGFTTGDVNLSASTTPGTLIGTVSGGPSTYTVAVSGMTGDGVVSASIPAGVAQDEAGNTSTVSSTTDNSVTYDSVSPGVTINQAAGQSDPVNAGPIHFTAVFTEPVTGFATGDVTLTSALAGLTQTVTESAPMDGTIFDISVGGLSGSGTVTASIAAGVAADAAARGNTASTSTDNTVTFDAVAPETSIDTHPAASTTSTSATFTFSATDSGTGVAGFACDLDGGGFNTCTSPRNLTGLSSGNHTFQVRATDAIGNTDATPASFTWSVDASAPVVNTFTITSPSTSLNISVTDFTATDDIAVTGFLITTSSTAPAAGATGWVGTAPAVFTVIADGTYTLYPWAKDAAGRVSAVFSTPRSVTVDATAPSVTINQAAGQADPVRTGPVTFTAVFSEPVTGFDSSDVNTSASTAPGVAVGTVTGGPSTFTITANATGDGAIMASIPAGAASDATSNTSTVSTSTDNSVTLDNTNPTVAIDSITPDPTNAGATVSWHSDDNGAYSVRVGGTTCSTGTQITSGAYATSPATINSVIPAANLTAGVNTVRVCVTDGAANTGSTSGTVTKEFTPIVTTNAATPVGNTTATLRGTVNANGSATTIQFQYGLTAAYGTTVNAVPATATGSANRNVSAALTGLTPNTTYHYRVVGINANGTTNGADQLFTTSDLSINLRFHDFMHVNVNWASIGDLLHVQAEVTHTNPTAPTGALVFTRYNNVSCYGTGAAAGSFPIAATVDPSQSTTLTGNGLSFKARYAGDSTYPAVESPCSAISTTADLSILPDSTGTSPRDGITVTRGLSSLVVQFNSDVLHNNATDGFSVLNPANFLLVSRLADNHFNTINCAGGLVADDSGVTVDSISYNAATYTATLAVNGGTRLPAGYYRLFVCGTTSITDPTGARFLNGRADDSRISFRVIPGAGGSSGSSDSDDAENVKLLPVTGFAPGKVTLLPDPTDTYNDADNLRLEIPRLGVDTSIVGVPVSKDGAAWDVTWLGSNAGWLNGTAFPSFAGNSVITGHVWDADNQPGIFVNLKDLIYGDKVAIYAYGWVYTYEVRDTVTTAPDAVRDVIRHEDNPWVTLVTCEDFNTGTTEYSSRRVVRAVLVNMEVE